MIGFSFIIPLIILSLPIFGLFVIVKKEAMETQQNMSTGEKVAEKNQPAFHLFLYLTNFFALGFLLSGIINIYFQLVNKYVEDTALENISQYDDGSLKYGLAVLVIAGLIYFPIAYLINKKIEKGEIRSDSLVRKFLTYIALFILTAIAVGNLVALFYNYLTGELTGNIFWKIVAFFVATAFFAYFYFWEIRRKESIDKNYKIFYAVAVAIALSGLITGIVIGDSPKVAREKRIDSQVVMEMQNMRSNIESIYTNTKKLPIVQEIQKSAKFEIDYVVKNDKEYQLCSVFLQGQDEKDFYMKEWNHPVGNYCFTFNIEARDNRGLIAPVEMVK